MQPARFTGTTRRDAPAYPLHCYGYNNHFPRHFAGASGNLHIHTMAKAKTSTATTAPKQTPEIMPTTTTKPAKGTPKTGKRDARGLSKPARTPEQIAKGYAVFLHLQFVQLRASARGAVDASMAMKPEPLADWANALHNLQNLLLDADDPTRVDTYIRVWLRPHDKKWGTTLEADLLSALDQQKEAA
jgi:hypothetical protein